MKTLDMFLMCIFLICGCEQSTTPVDPRTQNTAGTVAFSFDKANAPAEVKILTTVLSRSGFSPIEKSIQITTDTSAEVLFEQVAVGTWKIKIDAKNETGQVIYTGQSEVIVLEGTVSMVNLVMSPVASGVGSVQINVTWGTSNLQFLDYTANPILMRMGINIDGGGIGQPKIFVEDGFFRLYYLNYSFPSPVSYAESFNGYSWSRTDTIPVIKQGFRGSWDDGGTGPGPVYKVSDKYYMAYQGYDVNNKHFKVGLAVSSNGKEWEKYPDPIFSDSLSWEGNIVAGDVKLINEKYYMYYASNGNIGLAISTDGIHWVRKQNTPIIKPSQSWEKNNITFPSVVNEGNKYTMVYMNNASSYADIAFGMATSLDGINWIKETQNPIFIKSKTYNNWAVNGIVYPYLVKVGSELRIYYTGITPTNEWKIGVAYRK